MKYATIIKVWPSGPCQCSSFSVQKPESSLASEGSHVLWTELDSSVYKRLQRPLPPNVPKLINPTHPQEASQMGYLSTWSALFQRKGIHSPTASLCQRKESSPSSLQSGQTFTCSNRLVVLCLLLFKYCPLLYSSSSLPYFFLSVSL